MLDDAGRVFSTNYTFWSEITLFLLVEVLQILVRGKQVCLVVASVQRTVLFSSCPVLSYGWS